MSQTEHKPSLTITETTTQPQQQTSHKKTTNVNNQQKQLNALNTQPIPRWISVVAGTLSGAFTAIQTAPLDLLKTRQQVHTRSHHTVFHYAKEVIFHDGVIGLWAGLSTTLIGLIPTWAIYWTAYHSTKNYQTQKLGYNPDSSFVHLRAALTAGVVTSLSTNPIWVLKTRFQTQTKDRATKRYFGIIQAVRTILKEEGIIGFYKGLVPSIFGVLHVCVQFPLYERLKLQFAKRGKKTVPDLTTPEIIVCSTAAKVVASVAAYPHEVVRVRQQEDRHGHHTKVVKLIRDIYIKEGIRGFYRGMSTNLLRVVPASAVTFVSFEYISKKLNKYRLQYKEGT